MPRYQDWGTTGLEQTPGGLWRGREGEYIISSALQSSCVSSRRTANRAFLWVILATSTTGSAVVTNYCLYLSYSNSWHGHIILFIFYLFYLYLFILYIKECRPFLSFHLSLKFFRLLIGVNLLNWQAILYLKATPVDVRLNLKNE